MNWFTVHATNKRKWHYMWVMVNDWLDKNILTIYAFHDNSQQASNNSSRSLCAPSPIAANNPPHNFSHSLTLLFSLNLALPLPYVPPRWWFSFGFCSFLLIFLSFLLLTVSALCVSNGCVFCFLTILSPINVATIQHYNMQTFHRCATFKPWIDMMC